MPIVSGLDKFRDAMRGHEEKFVLIGGGACSLLFSELGADDFRSTKDLDLVILVDGKDAGFMRSLRFAVRHGREVLPLRHQRGGEHSNRVSQANRALCPPSRIRSCARGLPYAPARERRRHPQLVGHHPR